MILVKKNDADNEKSDSSPCIHHSLSIQQTMHMHTMSSSFNQKWINGAAKTVHCIWKNKHTAENL